LQNTSGNEQTPIFCKPLFCHNLKKQLALDNESQGEREAERLR